MKHSILAAVVFVFTTANNSFSQNAILIKGPLVMKEGWTYSIHTTELAAAEHTTNETMRQNKKIFSSVADSTVHNGNWSDPAIWSNGIPSSGDYVIINHNVHLDVNVTLSNPGKLFISASGELCGDHDFTGCFEHYGALKIRYLYVPYGSSYSYGQFMISNGATVWNSGTSWTVTPPGYGCIGCPFTCNPIIPWETPIADFNSDTVICEGSSVQFNDLSKKYPSSWAWSFPGGTPTTSSQQNPTITYNQSGTYDVTLIAGNSLGSDTITKVNYITVLASPTATVSSNSTITYGENAFVSATGGGSYFWNNGVTDSLITVSPTETTVYCVTVTNSNNCSNTACITVTFDDICVNGIYLPNAFSPDSNNENDFLQIYYTSPICVQSIHFILFDRWGEKLFENNDPLFKWNGMRGNQTLSTQVLTYSLSAELINGKNLIKTGNVSLIR